MSKKYLTPEQVEDTYGISTKTLANWRCQGKGPAYHKYSGRIRYHPDDLEQWARQFRVQTVDMPTMPQPGNTR